MPLPNGIKIPKPGLRNTKTALSVFLCILLFELIGRPNPLFACSAAIICMKETIRYSYQMGVDRLIGTLLGGLVGLAFLLINNRFSLPYAEALVAGLGILTVIYLCNLFNKSSAAVISSIVVLAIIIGVGEKSPYLYALDRMLDTAAGIVIALLVNKYIYPHKNGEQIPGLNNKGPAAGV
ncbi:MAG: hypothetical protein GX952_06470 [Firmicutes bacterium]|nr:hypothetical protein [Bacillota bacterium]